MLVLVLVLLSGLSLLTLGMSFRSRLESRMVSMQCREVQARELAQAGLEHMIELIEQDDAKTDHLGEDWATVTGAPIDLPELRERFPNMFLRVVCSDEQGRVNVNLAAADQLAAVLAGNEHLVAAILDWIDEDDTMNGGGAESDYYRGQPMPYVAGNAKLADLDTLLLVRGVTRPIYYGQLAQGRPAAPGRELPVAEGPPGLRDLLTVHGSGKINVNTASAQVLRSIVGLREEAVRAIIAERAGPDGRERTPDDTPFQSATDLATRCSLTDFEKTLIEQSITMTSTYFRLEATAGLDSKVTCRLEMIVKRDAKQPKQVSVLSLREVQP